MLALIWYYRFHLSKARLTDVHHACLLFSSWIRVFKASLEFRHVKVLHYLNINDFHEGKCNPCVYNSFQPYPCSVTIAKKILTLKLLLQIQTHEEENVNFFLTPAHSTKAACFRKDSMQNLHMSPRTSYLLFLKDWFSYSKQSFIQRN